MKAWTLNQLWYANEVCFPEDLERLWDKHAELDDQGQGMYHSLRMLKDFDNNLIRWMQSYGRASLDDGLGKVFDAILTELIGDYE